jgi:hypothetical protein
MNGTNAEQTVVAAVKLYSWDDLQDVHGAANCTLDGAARSARRLVHLLDTDFDFSRNSHGAVASLCGMLQNIAPSAPCQLARQNSI